MNPNAYSLIDYFDVWGNDIDGYEVNDQVIIKRGLQIPDLDSELLTMLVDMNYLKSFDTSLYEVISNDENLIEIFTADNNYPLYALTLEQ